jgi:DNA-binding transcriptional LysR family regulator
LTDLSLPPKSSKKSVWGKAWESLPVRRPLTAKEIESLPLILPEPGAGRRQPFDQWFAQASDQLPNVVLEVGGWHSILSYVQSGIGVGFVSEQAVQSFEQNQFGGKASGAQLSIKMLDEKNSTPDESRLIARKPQGRGTPDLGTTAYRLFELLRQERPVN